MDPGGDFNFQNLPGYKFSHVENTELKDSISKWSMANGLKIQAYSFDKPFKKYNERDFIVDFFGCQVIVSTLMKATPDHMFTPLGIPAEVVKFSEVKCTLTTLELFERLKDGNRIVRESGAIVKCMPHYIKSGSSEGYNQQGFEIEIADNLRKYILINEDDDATDDFADFSNDVLSEVERKEFLFSLFSHLVIGGSLCQYEDHLDPYTEATKLLYKDLIAVARVDQEGDGDNDKLKVISHVYKIHSASSSVPAGAVNILFHRDYINNFFYLIINPLKQLCFTIYHHV